MTLKRNDRPAESSHVRQKNPVVQTLMATGMSRASAYRLVKTTSALGADGVKALGPRFGAADLNRAAGIRTNNPMARARSSLKGLSDTELAAVLHEEMTRRLECTTAEAAWLMDARFGDLLWVLLNDCLRAWWAEVGADEAVDG